MVHHPVAITAEGPLSKALDNQSITAQLPGVNVGDCVNTRHDCTGQDCEFLVRFPWINQV